MTNVSSRTILILLTSILALVTCYFFAPSFLPAITPILVITIGLLHQERLRAISRHSIISDKLAERTVTLLLEFCDTRAKTRAALQGCIFCAVFNPDDEQTTADAAASLHALRRIIEQLALVAPELADELDAQQEWLSSSFDSRDVEVAKSKLAGAENHYRQLLRRITDFTKNPL